MSTWIIAVWNYVWEALRTHPFNFFTLLIAAAATIYARSAANAAKRQADEAERARKLSEEAARSQAEQTSMALAVAEWSTKAAEQSANATKILAEIGQRAWVSVAELKATTGNTHGYPKVMDMPDDYVKALLTIKSGGNSPALEFAATSLLQLLERAPIAIGTTALDGASTSVVGPHEIVQIPKYREGLTADQWHAIAQGSQILLLYGVCRYKDIFGQTHHTRWCYRFIPNTQQFSPYISNFNTMD